MFEYCNQEKWASAMYICRGYSSVHILLLALFSHYLWDHFVVINWSADKCYLYNIDDWHWVWFWLVQYFIALAIFSSVIRNNPVNIIIIIIIIYIRLFHSVNFTKIKELQFQFLWPFWNYICIILPSYWRDNIKYTYVTQYNKRDILSARFILR